MNVVIISHQKRTQNDLCCEITSVERAQIYLLYVFISDIGQSQLLFATQFINTVDDSKP